ncbi:recombinase family protein [Pseudomonas sp. WS 5411]|uniref:recombinase family protein n=1 Tax=Pseudomonas sp. WS 5411 TaxID=2717486 RepID=UPI001474291A|nr:recombinase family protein [Pseudomonas sp. WS 5411]NMY87334.1 recombinase family protein [Pseudomonas sp. WS 5411]
MFIRAYLRASTDEQDAGRARASLEQFASDHNKVIASVYLENASGATADRPELLRLLKDARKGDVLLVEMMAAIARKDYEQRRERQAQGIEKAKAAGKYQGRPVNIDLHKRVTELLGAGLGVRATARHANCSTTTVLRIRDRA